MNNNNDLFLKLKVSSTPNWGMRSIVIETKDPLQAAP